MPNLTFRKFQLPKTLWFGLILLGLIPTQQAHAEFDLECYLKNNCSKSWGRTSSNPSSGGQVRINPSAVPTDAGFGIETIVFKTDFDFALASGTGRVGAAISPSNSEETFFGPPGFELPEDYLVRKTESKKFPTQKYTLAGAISLIDKKGTGFRAFSLKLGAMGKYNKLTTGVNGGLGITGILGPFTFGGSAYSDETQLDYGTYSTYGSTEKPVTHYMVQTYNVGLFLNSLILDYSHLKLTSTDEANVSLITASFMYKKFIFTASKRSEISSRLTYNYETKQLEYKNEKAEYFGGIQMAATKSLMIGALYNYYLLHEVSVAATLFF